MVQESTAYFVTVIAERGKKRRDYFVNVIAEDHRRL
jgi:hypothetical protein